MTRAVLGHNINSASVRIAVMEINFPKHLDRLTSSWWPVEEVREVLLRVRRADSDRRRC